MRVIKKADRQTHTDRLSGADLYSQRHNLSLVSNTLTVQPCSMSPLLTISLFNITPIIRSLHGELRQDLSQFLPHSHPFMLYNPLFTCYFLPHYIMITKYAHYTVSLIELPNKAVVFHLVFIETSSTCAIRYW
jgi:hypothetical protein